MVKNENRNVILLSIHPRFADLILNGDKTVEFRKTKMSRDVSRVVIYSTAPVKKIVGYFEVKEIVNKKPMELWNDFKNVGGINREEFIDYYDQREMAFGLIVSKAVRLKKPLELYELGDKITPPQSYRYLDWDVVKEKVSSRDHWFVLLTKKIISSFAIFEIKRLHEKLTLSLVK